MRTAWVLGLFTLALIFGGVSGGVEPAAGFQCEGECPLPVAPTATAVPEPPPIPPSSGNSNDGGRQGQDGGRHGQDGGGHGREEGRPDLTTLARGSVIVHRMPGVAVPGLEPADGFLDLSQR